VYLWSATKLFFVPVQNRIDIQVQQIRGRTSDAAADVVKDVVITHASFAVNRIIRGGLCGARLVIIIRKIRVHWVPAVELLENAGLIPAKIAVSLITLERDTSSVDGGNQLVIPINAIGASEYDAFPIVSRVGCSVLVHVEEQTADAIRSIDVRGLVGGGAVRGRVHLKRDGALEGETNATMKPG